MILLQAVFEILVVAMSYTGAQGRPDRAGTAVVPSVVTRSGVMPVTLLADTKNAFAAAILRCSLNITSTSAPERSMAR